MTEEELIITGKWSIETLINLMVQAGSIDDPGERIDFISRRFLGTPYQESTLIGDQNREELLVINLEALDCFTFIDYVEAVRLSSSFPEFKESLKKIRYQGGMVSFDARNHFFTDWVEFNNNFVEDVTETVGVRKTTTVLKTLNLKEDGTFFLPGLGPLRREIKYVPSSSLDNQLIGRLKTGDYIGLYSDVSGLDVSHVGIFIKEGNVLILRHASSKKEHCKVVDQDFLEYVSNKPGIIVLRPKQ
jgi:hypothetical protein